MKPEQRAAWVKVAGQLHSRLRKLALLGLVVLAAVVNDWFSSYQRLEKERLLLTPPVNRLVVESLASTAPAPFDLEIRKARKDPRCLVKSNSVELRVRIGCLPSLSLVAAGSDEKKRIFGQELPETPYQLAVLLAPIVFLFGTLATVRQLRRLHELLASETRSASVWQELNSPYHARVTTTYGERWGSQTLMAAAIGLVNVLAAFMYVPAALAAKNVVRVSVVGDRVIFADLLTTFEGTTTALNAIWMVATVSALVLWVAIVLGFRRMVDARRLKT
jgi:hypothetical protein